MNCEGPHPVLIDSGSGRLVDENDLCVREVIL